MFWQIALGETVSDTVTVEEHVEVFPLASFTVSVTLFSPISAHVNAVWEALNVNAEQLPVDPPSISAATIEAFPVRSRYTVMFWQIAVGVWFTVKLIEITLSHPNPSCRVSVKTPVVISVLLFQS